MEKPLYFIFPMLDQKSLRWLIPERQAMHNEMDRLLKMLDGIIVQKKEMIKQGNTQNDNLEENEKDLLSLMIESELRGEGVITEEELKVNRKTLNNL
jgi:cytochrome P450